MKMPPLRLVEDMCIFFTGVAHFDVTLADSGPLERRFRLPSASVCAPSTAYARLSDI